MRTRSGVSSAVVAVYAESQAILDPIDLIRPVLAVAGAVAVFWAIASRVSRSAERGAAAPHPVISLVPSQVDGIQPGINDAEKERRCDQQQGVALEGGI